MFYWAQTPPSASEVVQKRFPSPSMNCHRKQTNHGYAESEMRTRQKQRIVTPGGS